MHIISFQPMFVTFGLGRHAAGVYLPLPHTGARGRCHRHGLRLRGCSSVGVISLATESGQCNNCPSPFGVWGGTRKQWMLRDVAWHPDRVALFCQLWGCALEAVGHAQPHHVSTLGRAAQIWPTRNVTLHFVSKKHLRHATRQYYQQEARAGTWKPP